MLSQEITTELVDGLLNIFGDNVYQIILYGSVARGEATKESDVDIAIVLEKNCEKSTKDRFIAWASQLDMKYEKVFSVVDIEKENLEKWENTLPFYKNLREEGIVLWKAV